MAVVPRGYRRVHGSDREPYRNARRIGGLDKSEIASVTLRLAPQRALPKPTERITYEDLHRYGIEDGVDRLLGEFAVRHGLTLASVDPIGRKAVIEGSVVALEKAFGVELDRYEADTQVYRGRVGPVFIPSALEGVVQAVLGLDNRREASVLMPKFYGSTKVLLPTELLHLYNVPASDGAGQTVAVVLPGGGYSLSVLQAYWRELGFTTIPTVVNRPTNGWVNNPADDWATELHMDVAAVGAMANRSRIAVYGAPHDVGGFPSALNTAVHDTVERPSVLTASISYSQGIPDQMRTAMDQDFMVAASLGITACVASGDWGSSGTGTVDTPPPGQYPSDSPYVVSVGGTNLSTNDAGTVITNEEIWHRNQTYGTTHGRKYIGGGGVSPVAPKPSWQSGYSIPVYAGPGSFVGRGWPDFSLTADLVYGRSVAGSEVIYGGTSVSSPLMAGIFARINQIRGARTGFPNAVFYAKPWAFRDLTGVFNIGHYLTGPGYDVGTGLGAINVGLMLSALGSPKTVGKATTRRSGFGRATARLVKKVNLVAKASVRANGNISTAGAMFPEMAFDDFGAWDPVQPDPAISRYIGSGQTLGREPWSRIWLASTAPKEYRLANGKGRVLWNRAAYLGMGVKSVGVAPEKYMLHSHAQIEKLDKQWLWTTTLAEALPALFSDDPRGVLATVDVTSVPDDWPEPPFHLVISRHLTDQETVLVRNISGNSLTMYRGRYSAMPAHTIGAVLRVAELTDYEKPRTVYLDIRPDLINYVPNPGFELGLAYVGANGVTHARASGLPGHVGLATLSVKATSGSGDAFALETFPLRRSTQVTWSCYVFSTVGTWLDLRQMGLQEITPTGTLGRRVAAGTETRAIAPMEWHRLQGTAWIPANFGSEVALMMRPASQGAAAAWDTNVTLFYDSLMVEDGAIVHDYFDGGFLGGDYMWEQSESGIIRPHESRSYYYKGLAQKRYRVEQMVKQWIPYGSSYRIRYGTPPL